MIEHHLETLTQKHAGDTVAGHIRRCGITKSAHCGKQDRQPQCNSKQGRLTAQLEHGKGQCRYKCKNWGAKQDRSDLAAKSHQST